MWTAASDDSDEVDRLKRERRWALAMLLVLSAAVLMMVGDAPTAPALGGTVGIPAPVPGGTAAIRQPGPAGQASAADPPPVAAALPREPLAGRGLPFGPFEPLWEDLGSRFSGGWIPVSPSYAVGDLSKVQAAGASVAVRLSGGRSHFKNSDGTFNLELWKARLDAYAGIDLEPFIADGTILVHYLIDEPKCVSCWGGQVVTNDVLDAMAAYSKAKWPNLATAVRVSPLDLVAHGGGEDVAWPEWEWRYLDTAWSQYSARKGEVVAYAKAQQASAAAQGLGHIVGLNVFKGGDGSSGWPSHPDFPGGWAMSPSELSTYALALMNNTQACGFIMWRYDYGGYTYFERPDIATTITQLATEAAKHDTNGCVR